MSSYVRRFRSRKVYLQRVEKSARRNDACSHSVNYARRILNLIYNNRGRLSCIEFSGSLPRVIKECGIGPEVNGEDAFFYLIAWEKRSGSRINCRCDTLLAFVAEQAREVRVSKVHKYRTVNFTASFHRASIDNL